MLTVSMHRLLKADALNDPEVKKLKGRAVIIAPNNIGTRTGIFRRIHGCCPATDNEPMTGGEIHANAIETIMSGIYPRSLSHGLPGRRWCWCWCCRDALSCGCIPQPAWALAWFSAAVLIPAFSLSRRTCC
jgi:CHASE2 domain-containing sensor protein